MDTLFCSLLWPPSLGLLTHSLLATSLPHALGLTIAADGMPKDAEVRGLLSCLSLVQIVWRWLQLGKQGREFHGGILTLDLSTFVYSLPPNPPVRARVCAHVHTHTHTTSGSSGTGESCCLGVSLSFSG